MTEIRGFPLWRLEEGINMKTILFDKNTLKISGYCSSAQPEVEDYKLMSLKDEDDIRWIVINKDNKDNYSYKIDEELKNAAALEDKEYAWKIVRNKRNSLLQSCDWTQLTDCDLTSSEKSKWKIYRQSLRDITTCSDPKNINWPDKP